MTNPTTFVGTAKDIGADLFIHMCLPVIREGSKHMEPEQLAQMYGGMVGAAFGAMAADFGQQNALHLFQVMVASFAKFQPLQETH